MNSECSMIMTIAKHSNLWRAWFRVYIPWATKTLKTVGSEPKTGVPEEFVKNLVLTNRTGFLQSMTYRARKYSSKNLQKPVKNH